MAAGVGVEGLQIDSRIAHAAAEAARVSGLSARTAQLCNGARPADKPPACAVQRLRGFESPQAYAAPYGSRATVNAIRDAEGYPCSGAVQPALPCGCLSLFKRAIEIYAVGAGKSGAG